MHRTGHCRQEREQLQLPTSPARSPSRAEPTQPRSAPRLISPHPSSVRCPALQRTPDFWSLSRYPEFSLALARPAPLPCPPCDVGDWAACTAQHDSDVVACVRPSSSRAEPRVEWIRVRVRITAAQSSTLVVSCVSSLAFPQLFLPHSARRATRLAEANRLFALSVAQSFPPIAPEAAQPLQIYLEAAIFGILPAPDMGSRRYDVDTRRCGIHSTPSKSMYLDAQQPVNCQATVKDHDVGSCAVKHHFPSPIVSWIEDLSSFGNASFSTDTEYVDEQARASFGQSSTSSNLHDMQISVRLTDEFMELAKENTSNNLETCGILGASFRDGTYFVTMLIIPKQEGTAHSCQAVSEEEIHAVLSEQSLYPAGWIHTHPSQTCFLSSIDLHTQYSYQVMLPEAVAIVVAPTDPTRSYGIFRLTDPGGMDVLRECDESGFHTHRETTDGSPIYETCSKVHFNPNLRFEIVDLRSVQ